MDQKDRCSALVARLDKANQLSDRLGKVFDEIASKANDCHNPSGPAGGQFCSGGSGGGVATPDYSKQSFQDMVGTVNDVRRKNPENANDILQGLHQEVVSRVGNNVHARTIGSSVAALHTGVDAYGVVLDDGRRSRNFNYINSALENLNRDSKPSAFTPQLIGATHRNRK